MKYAPILTMTEVQPLLTHLLQDMLDPTPVRLGRSHTPVIALVPWPRYLAWAWREALGPEQPKVLIAERSTTQAVSLFLSYRHRVAPLLASDAQIIRIIWVKVHNHEIGAIMNWQDWLRSAPADSPDTASVAFSPAGRSFSIVSAHKHLSQFIDQFKQEADKGVLEAITVTKRGEPVLAIVPWALYLQWRPEVSSPDEADAPLVPSHPWPVGTACVLSSDGQSIYDAAHGDDPHLLLVGSVFYLLGTVNHYVPAVEYNNPAAQRYREPGGHYAVDNTLVGEASTLYYTSLFSLDARETGILCDHELSLAPKQPQLETDEQIEGFLVQALGPCGGEVLLVYRQRRQTVAPRQALEGALWEGMASGCIPWLAQPRQPYASHFDPDDQVEAEDWIAVFLFETAGMAYEKDPEQAAAFLTEQILEEMRHCFEKGAVSASRMETLRKYLIGQLVIHNEQTIDHYPHEEACNQAGREILYHTISAIRPDLLQQPLEVLEIHTEVGS
ncbi:MAG: hypothetical protein ABI234_06245 [Ktedonobacteraceae bacterium]